MLAVAAALPLVACGDGPRTGSAVCGDGVVCGYFTIARQKESTPIFFATGTASPAYRLCVEEGSVILQTIEADGNALSLGGEIRAGSCAEMSFADKVYIIGNTADGRSRGFYYRVP